MPVNLKKLIDLDLLSYFKVKLDLLFAGKVDKENGKGLSSNDYTSIEKTKLSGISDGAQANILEGIQKNGTTVSITNKIANISVPTKLTDLTNDGNFVTDAYYTHTDNNYTSTEKTKLGGVAAGAQVNVLESIKVNGTTQTVTGKAVDISIPTKTSDITNDSGFITISDVPDGAAASTATPLMDGTADVGTSAAFARGDHVHPSDSTKVDKVTGKGLSTEDYTTTEKNKLSGIATGAQVNVLEGVNVNGNAQTVTSKAVNLIIPDVCSGTNLSSTTASTGVVAVLSDGNSGGDIDIIIPAPYDGTTITGSAAYIPAAYFNTSMQGALQSVDSALLLKADASNVYTKTEIDQKLVGAMNYKGTVATVANLPSSGVSSGDVYHVTSDGSERAWNGSAWEELGTAVDLSGYVESSDLGLATNAEIDALFE